MRKPLRSKSHLQAVANQPCMVCGNDYGVQAHHLLKPWIGVRGVGLRASDQNAVPMCHIHHRELHDRGDEESYFLETFGDMEAGRDKARELWCRSPSYKGDQ